MYIQLNSWASVNLGNFSTALAVDVQTHDQLFDAADIDYSIFGADTLTNTSASGTEAVSGYQYAIQGNNFTDNSAAITVNSIRFSDTANNQSYTYTSAGIKVNYNSGKITGTWSSLQYNDLSANTSYTLTGKFGFDKSGLMSTSTITSISYTSSTVSDYTIKGKLQTNSSGVITAGSISEISFVDTSGNKLKFSNLSLNWSQFQSLTSGQSNLNALYQSVASEALLKGDDVIEGMAADDTLNGYGGNDKLYGNAGNDIVNAGKGKDLLDGGAGSDTLAGGLGNDTYIVDDDTDVILENLNEGTDLVKASSDYTLSNNIELLTLTDGSANGGNMALNGTGNTSANTITGNAGNNIIDGAAGVDTLIGGLGDDTYIVDLLQSGKTPAKYKLALQDKITEKAGEGNDTVQVRGSYTHINASTLTLANHLENLDASKTNSTKLNLIGNKLDNSLTGNDADNLINGGDGNDILTGGLGVDTLTGGNGNDTFAYVSANDSTSSQMDTITDFKSGQDTIKFYQLSGNNQNLSFSNTSASAYAVWYAQSSGYTLVFVDTSGDATADMQIKLNGLFDLTSANFNLASSASTSTGTSGNSNSSGSTSGGTTTPSLFTANTDTVNFNNIQSLATYASSGIYNALAGNDIINLPESATKATSIGYDASQIFHGGIGDDNIIGGTMDDIISGDAGADRLSGGLGNDTYYVDNVNDVVLEQFFIYSTENGYYYENGYTDTIYASVSYTADFGVSNLTLTGSENINGYGSDLKSNVITGNDGNNILDGGIVTDPELYSDKYMSTGSKYIFFGGFDTLIGGKGDDTYILHGGETVIENENEGTDTFVLMGSEEIPAAYLMGQDSNIENLTLYDDNVLYDYITATIKDNLIIANNLANSIYGLQGDDTLKALGGDDRLYGMQGHDSLWGGAGADTFVFESAGADTFDTVYDFVSGEDKIQISGFAPKFINGIYADMFVSGSGSVISAQDGNDYLIYNISTGDLFFDDDGNGENNAVLIANFQANTTIVLSDFIDWRSQAKPQYIDGSLNDDTLVGGEGNDHINGLTGNDTIYGNAGDDTIYGDTGSDLLTGNLGADTFIWKQYDMGFTTDLSKATDTISDFSVEQGDVLNLSGMLQLETANNILNYLDLSIESNTTTIRISTNGNFINGIYDSANENARVILSNTNIATLSGTNTESGMIDFLLNQQSLMIGIDPLTGL